MRARGWSELVLCRVIHGGPPLQMLGGGRLIVVSFIIEEGHLREGNGVLAIELLFQLLKGCFGIYLVTCLSSKI